jgi:hypothetical protein
MRDFARGLLAQEAKGNRSSGTRSPVVFGAVIDKLREPLIVLAGTEVFRSLLSRALVLASVEVRSLRGLHITPSGSLGRSAALDQLNQKELSAAEIVLLAHLLAMLVAFIGQSLTLRLLQDVWPGAPFNNFNSNAYHSKQDEP